jgi:hypothetical protein
MLYGGVQGAQQTVDPMTGQPVGGGLTGALKGAIGGGTAGGVTGLGAQGAIRSGLKAREIMQHAAAAGRPVKGGYLGAFGRQAGLRAGNFAHDVGGLATEAGHSMQDLSAWTKDKTRKAVAGMSDVAPAAAPVPPAA